MPTKTKQGSTTKDKSGKDREPKDDKKDKDKDKDPVFDPNSDETLDRDLVENLRWNLIHDKSKDGINAHLFPLTSKDQADYTFRMIGRERLNGRDVFHITFRPKEEGRLRLERRRLHRYHRVPARPRHYRHGAQDSVRRSHACSAPMCPASASPSPTRRRRTASGSPSPFRPNSRFTCSTSSTARSSSTPRIATSRRPT